MKLKLLTGNGLLKIVQANRVKGKKQDYFNIQHGSLDYGLHSYNIHIESKDYDASLLKDEFITLTEDKYVLKPIYVNNEVLKDRIGNVKYKLTKDDNYSHKDDLLLFIELPNFNYKEVKFIIINGNCSYLGMGITGRNRDNVIYKSPAPILETSGDFSIAWTGKDINENIVGLIMNYDSKTGSFTNIIINKDNVPTGKVIEIKE